MSEVVRIVWYDRLPSEKGMKSQVLHTVCVNIPGEAAGEI